MVGRRDADSTQAVVAVIEVVRLGLGAGLRPPAALDLAARYLGATDGGALDAYRLRSERGASFAEAAEVWAAAVGGPAPSPADEVVDLLVGAQRTGASVGPALDRLAHDLRRRHRQRAQERARRLPVWMVVPLVVCVLPAFGLVAVVPMLAVGLQSLRLA